MTVIVSNTAPVFSLDAPGFWTSHLVGANDIGSRVLVQPDGKLVVVGRVAGSLTTEFLMQRFHEDGTVDTTFNGGAASTATLPANGFVSSATLDADGNILVGGFALRTGSFSQFALVRYTPDGALDTTFDDDGIVLTQIGERSDQARAMLVQADGKIILAGSTQTGASSTTRDVALVRYNADGSLDSDFGTDGIMLIATPGTSDVITGLAAVSGGFLAVGNQAVAGVSNNVVLMKFNDDGTPDISFGTSGVQALAISPASSALASNGILIQEDGKIVVTGYEDRGLADGSTSGFIMRFNADGTPDTGFDGDGKVLLQLSATVDQVLKVVQQDDGKLVVSGLSLYSDTSNHGFVARFNLDGSLDTSFSDDGIAWSPFPSPADDAFQSIALQDDGKMVVTGFRAHAGSPFPDDNDLTLVRYKVDGTLDPTFNATSSLDSTAAYTENASAIVLEGTAAIYDAELTAINDYGGASLYLQRHDGMSAQDVFGASGEVSLETPASGNVSVGATVVGTFSSGAGAMYIQFNAGATSTQVNTVMSSLTYANTSEVPPASVTIDWVFGDGNYTDAQGAGGAKSINGSTTITITEVNDLPTGSVTVSGQARVGETLSVQASLSDADGGAGAYSYTWLRGDTPIPHVTTATYTVQEADIGFSLRAVASYIDGGGRTESVTSDGTVSVGMTVTTPRGSHEVVGTAGNDALVSGHGRDLMIGGAGDDVYYVNDGKDTIEEEVDGGTDTVISRTDYVLSDNVENLILAGDARLHATGNDLDNTITGNNANNRLIGGLGEDTLTGGDGADKFTYLTTADSDGSMVRDVITDFSSNERDVINLKAIDANSTRAGDQAFKFIGSAEFSQTNATAQLRFDPATHTLYASTDADADAEFSIELTGVNALDRDDFVL